MAAVIIIVSGIAVFAYAAFQIDWANIEPSFKSIFFPVLFFFIVVLFAFKVASNKDIDVTSKETDSKISEAIDSFNHKTRHIQNLVIGSIVLCLLAI
ncbi:hypothetical protein A3749_21390 [Oleiphilus sp. HI0078]|uniref:hypothetical protein n=1 Tax=Oleiphilus sp. HI0132 TaxID=1822270 RepID=UPI0007C38915|nr:hypothetical protein [Oleiphilus sp. HI0132]KZY35006.1 hypothetical protein A3729_17905 [Oleiphilus sp. HI0043]KZY58638.1 hypothetical protein A3735_17330 [Oleiphilus sp. HI0061]KZY74410.1 hypothetical protein A3740_16630 [Oleiphilus sp. HI0068]KZY81447.1 hypothetical protein A3741_17320 [Oleiphilus sp. HI0069]KZY88341.1 hypothetical protein A3743_11910 [Oleiphilus sp. HI0072]KZZ19084.1 hypothetical protein A3749_21390 [Oleiphilus sp. HI0078]KZZ33822.1 hypothetical protein A3755_07020 [Ol